MADTRLSIYNMELLIGGMFCAPEKVSRAALSVHDGGAS